MRRGFAVLVAALLAVVCAGAVGLPVLDLDERVQGDVGDPLLNVWALSWESTALVRDPGALYDGNIFWPDDSAIAYSESMLPLVPVFGLLRAVTGDELAANAVLVFALVLAAVAAAYALARRYVVEPATALLAGISYGLGGYAISHVAQVQLLTMGSFPLVFLLWFRALERRTWPSAVLCGVSVAVASLASLYYLVVLAPCLAAMALVHLARRRRRDRSTLKVMAIAGAVAVVLTVPGLLVYIDVNEERDLARPVEPTLELEADDFLTAPRETLLYEDLAHLGLGRAAPNEHALFPGFIVLGLAVVGLLAVRRHARRAELVALLAAATVAVVLAMGAEVGGVRLPFAVLHDHVPGYEGIRATARLVAPAICVLSVLGSIGLDRVLRRIPDRRRSIVVAAVCAVLVVELWAPVPWKPVDRGPALLGVYERLDELAAGAVVELPLGDPRLAVGAPRPTWALTEPSRMLRSLVDANPRVNGYSGHLPPRYLEFVDRLNDFPSADSRALLAELGVRYVLLHTGRAADDAPQYRAEEAAALVDRLPPGWQAERHGRSWLIEAPLVSPGHVVDP